MHAPPGKLCTQKEFWLIFCLWIFHILLNKDLEMYIDLKGRSFLLHEWTGACSPWKVAKLDAKVLQFKGIPNKLLCSVVDILYILQRLGIALQHLLMKKFQ